ncbi:MAG: phosphoglucosamine mutase [Actinomycetota bacterium]
MTPARFGTDGVRGVANVELTAEVALALGRAVALVIPATSFVVGRDTRRSGTMLEAAFAAGITTEGADVIDVGVLATPGIAFLADRRGLPGAVISASHNPFGDNGIKILGPGGAKLSIETEASIEEALRMVFNDPESAPRRPTGKGIGVINHDATSVSAYLDHLCTAVEGRDLTGLRIALDCANGAASAYAADVLRRLGAEVLVMADQPDGSNINDGVGSTAPGALAALVVESGCALGLALDGDADRVIAVDELGRVVDGDVLMALFATDLKARGRLAGNTVAVTVMSNLGFRRAMEAVGIHVVTTDVGDRNVVAALDAEGLSFGGEQSGHLIFRSWASTGDGLLTGILLTDFVARAATPLSTLADAAMVRYPQVLVNVSVSRPADVAQSKAVADVVAAEVDALGDEGRVMVRPSGTEPVVRVMVEAPESGRATSIAQRIATVVAATSDAMLEGAE